MKRLVIIGAGQHGKVVLNLLRTSKQAKDKFDVLGFIDDNPKLIGTTLLDLPVLGSFSELPKIKKRLRVDSAIMGISNLHMKVRARYFEQFTELGLDTPNAIHDTAVVEKTAKIGNGVVLSALCVVDAYASVGDNVVAYSGSTIEHEDVLADNVYLGPGVNFASGVRVGENTFVGAGTKVIPNITIGKNVTVGAGTVLIENVPDNTVVVGAPGRIVRRKD